jgi:biopolymer transport protein ExbB
MMDVINKGGVVNWVIVVLYFFVVGICIERGIYFYYTRVKFQEFIDNLFGYLREGREDVLKSDIFKFWGSSPVAKLAATYLMHLKDKEALRSEILDSEGAVEVERMGNYLGALSVIGHIAPLLGLLGTITGLIKAFQAIERLGGQVDVGILSGGIWEAMLTTTFGLSLAIPAFLMFSFFSNLVDTRTAQMSQLVSRLNVFFGRKGCDFRINSVFRGNDYDEIS